MQYNDGNYNGEDSEDQENLKALKNFQICMTQEGTPYGTWQTMEVVNT